MTEGIAEVAGRLGIGRLAFEASAVSVADFETLQREAATPSLAGVQGRVEALRMIKDPAEVAAIREAVDFAERAFAMLRAGLRADESEKDVADALEGYLRRCGASAASFPPIVAVGARAALPHARPSAATRIGQADFVLVDWGADRLGYKSDLTRVLVTGKVTPQVREGLSDRPGGARAWDRRDSARRQGPRRGCRSPLRDRGGRLRPFFSATAWAMAWAWTSTRPPCSAGNPKWRSSPAWSSPIEPGIYLPDWGGVRIEEDVLVTPDGCEVLSHVPKATRRRPGRVA